MEMKEPTLIEARYMSEMGWVYVADGAYFSGAARLRDAAEMLDQIGHKRLAVLRKVVASTERAS